MSFHRDAMAMSRQALDTFAGRTVSYFEPDGRGGAEHVGIIVRHGSAEDRTIDTDHGLERRRELTVNVGVGAGDGLLDRVDIGGKFMLDVDGGGEPDPWTIDSFPNSDAGGTTVSGFRRCLCVRPVQQGGRLGQRPRDRS